MGCSISIDGEILEIKSSDRLNLDERKRMLKFIASTYDDSRARAIIIDLSNTEIICTENEAISFGFLINCIFSYRWPCLIAILCKKDSPTQELIDLTAQSANEDCRKTKVKSFTNRNMALEEIHLWLKDQGKDIAALP